MRRYSVRYTAQANADISAIFKYTLERSRNFIIATSYTDRLYDRCLKIGDAPFGGVARDDIAAGLRLTVFERRVVILYRIEKETVWITAILSGGRDYASLVDRQADEG